MRKLALRLGITGSLIALFIWNPYPLQYLELKSYDTLIMSTEPVQNENILIVDLDEDLVKPTKVTLYQEVYMRNSSQKQMQFQGSQC